MVPFSGSRRRLARLASGCALATAPLACGDVARGAGPAAVPALSEAELARLDPLFAAAARRSVAAVAAAPDSAAAWADLAALYQANGHVALADHAWAETLARAPEDAFGWYARALGSLADGRIDAARAQAERAAALDPAYAPCLFRLGDWALAEGDLERASAWFERACAAEPAYPGGWIGRARVHLARGEPAEAAALLEAHVLGGPSDGYGRQLLARACVALGREAEARTLGAQGRGVEPEVADPRWSAIRARATGRHAELERASDLLRAGQPTAAVLVLEALARLSGGEEDPAVLSNLAFALLVAGRGPEALERARAAAALDPAAYRPILVEALALQRLGGAAALPDAIATLERALTLQPTAVDALLPLGVFRMQTGDREAALAAFERGLELAPDHPELLQNAGLVQRQLGLHGRAEATYRAWLALAPGHPFAAYGLAETRAAQGDHAEAALLLSGAVAALERAHGPAHADVRAARERLAASLEALGRLDEATLEHSRAR